MRERPILFSGPMVRAILDGRKTQTRRLLKSPYHSIEETDDGKLWPWREDLNSAQDYWYPCPYGQPGDRLWVRETWMQELHPGDCGLTRADIPRTWDAAVAAAGTIHYRADKGSDFVADGRPWRPSIHMPRRASRITLEITGVRVERLQEISEADAEAEGIDHDHLGRWADYKNIRNGGYFDHPIHGAWLSYSSLWESINGPGSWNANPYVWVIEFRRIDGAQA